MEEGASNGTCRSGCESAYCSEEDELPCGRENGEDVNQTCPLSSFPFDEIVKREIDVDVAVIGNGPSAIFLSLLLSGYKPYFTGSHPNRILREKLRTDVPLLEQDFPYLSEGLEGRSRNPVSLLFDTLFHPNADIGQTHSSSLRWERDESSAISHVVLGCGKPGGVWHGVESSTLTLSHQEWLDLPLYSFNDWKKDKRRKEEKNDKNSKWRARAGHVAQYYQDYIHKMSLKDNFINSVMINRVEQRWDCPLSPNSPGHKLATPPWSPTSTSSSSTASSTSSVGIIAEGEIIHSAKCMCDKGVCCPTIVQCNPEWMLQGSYLKPSCCKRRDQEESSPSSPLSPYPSPNSISVKSRKIVLACGLTQPKRLEIPGEDLPFVTHCLSDFKKRLKCSKKRGRLGSALVVGAGMTGADAVLYCLNNDIHVNHSFYQDLSKANNLLLSKLPSGYYLEYQRVWKLMNGLERSHLYTPLQGTRVNSFSTNGETVLTSSGGSELNLATSVGMIAIGSQANLGFLPLDISSVLGIDPSQAIDSKNNSVDIDSFTSQSERVPNLYALGPLAGDNFVRFLFGSGLACAKSIQNSLCKTNLSPTQSPLVSTQANDTTILY